MHVPAVLGGRPKFDIAIPLVCPRGSHYEADFTAWDVIRANQPKDVSQSCSQQRVIDKILPRKDGDNSSYRSMLETRISTFLGLHPEHFSVIALSSGSNALRAVLKLLQSPFSTARRTEVIVPSITVDATIEAIIDQGLVPRFVDVNPTTWLMSSGATHNAINASTAAIITVDWLGTQCDLTPFRDMIEGTEILLISDSAQSFGSSRDGYSSFSVADATIFSMGYPKVLTGEGSGGLIVCKPSALLKLREDPSGILRHETMTESNAESCLQALARLPCDLEHRRTMGETYRRRLARLPGVHFQEILVGAGTNHYQISITIDREVFGLHASELCTVLTAERIGCTAGKMPCVALNQGFAQHGAITGDISHAKQIAANCITLPISNTILGETEKSGHRASGRPKS